MGGVRCAPRSLAIAKCWPAMASKRKRAGDGLRDVEEIKAHIEKRLFIGRLPTNIKQDELGDVFSAYGRLTECKMVPGRGVGFVGFETWGSAHRALLGTDGHPIINGNSNPAVVSFAERTSTVGKGGGKHLSKGDINSRLFVGGLAESVTEREINDMFSPFGTVEEIKLLPAKGHRRCGFVTLGVWGEALDAIEALDSQDKSEGGDGEPLTVVLAEPNPKEGGAGGAGRRSFDESRGGGPLGATPLARNEPPAKRRRVDGGGSFGGATRAEFESTLMSYFRAMDSAASAEVCDELHEKLMRLRVEHARGSQGPTSEVRLEAASRPASEPRHHSGPGAAADGRETNRLFIGGLPKECSDQELRALVDQISFATGGASELIECRTLSGRGCGYLRFSSSRAAEDAIDALNDRRVNGWKDILRARWAEPPKGSGGHEVENQTPRGQGGVAGSHVAEQPGRAAGRDGSRRRPVRDGGAWQEAGDDDGLDHCRLFVGQIQRKCDKEQLYQVFEPFGWIEEFKFLEDKCVAYVSYERADDAKRALRDLDGANLDNISRGTGGLNVQFSKKR